MFLLVCRFMQLEGEDIYHFVKIFKHMPLKRQVATTLEHNGCKQIACEVDGHLAQLIGSCVLIIVILIESCRALLPVTGIHTHTRTHTPPPPHIYVCTHTLYHIHTHRTHTTHKLTHTTLSMLCEAQWMLHDYCR